MDKTTRRPRWVRAGPTPGALRGREVGRWRRETGRTPRGYLRRLRLERAKLLLAADDRPVTDVALECGFCSPSHLATSFALAFGLPPSHYRSMLRRGRHEAQRR